MSVHDDLCDILDAADVAESGAYSEALPGDVEGGEYVIIRRTLNDPQMTLNGYAGITRDVFVFECWSDDKARSIAMAAAVAMALDADTSYPMKQREAPGETEDFDPEVMKRMEPVQYSIWHP